MLVADPAVPKPPPAAASDAATPLGAAEFAAAMAGLGGFEPAPRLAVAVSGGADSLALTLLAEEWAQARGGSVLGLSVDHGLRPESSTEATQLVGWLDRRGIATRVLTWTGTKPASGIQAGARTARYRLLEEACREAGILHLLTAHHRDDQAETVLLRLARGSGPDGLAGIAPIRELASIRLLRPLLGVPKARLEATCRAAGQPWLSDPGNLSPRFARGRLRQATTALARDGLDAAALAATARRCARARSALDRATADLLAAAVTIFPEGYLELAARPWRTAATDLRRRALARCLATIGDGQPIRDDALQRLEARMIELPEQSATLGGCRVLARPGGWRVVREPAAAAPIALGDGGDPGDLRWDQRFAVHLSQPPVPGSRLARLGESGGAARPGRDAALRSVGLPASVAAGLPTIWRHDDVVALVKIGRIPDSSAHRPVPAATARLVPLRPLAGAEFPVVSPGTGIILKEPDPAG